MTACEHQWEWVQPVVIYLVGSPYLEPGIPFDDRCVNARCTRCGETTWAHGWNVPIQHRASTHPGPRDPVLEQEC